jgi:hypothetical protein
LERPLFASVGHPSRRDAVVVPTPVKLGVRLLGFLLADFQFRSVLLVYRRGLTPAQRNPGSRVARLVQPADLVVLGELGHLAPGLHVFPAFR